MIESIDALGVTAQRIMTSESPRKYASREIQSILDELIVEIGPYDTFQICEVVRLAFLPWSVGETVQPGTEDGVALSEIMALIAVTRDESTRTQQEPSINLFTDAKRWKRKTRELVDLAQILQLLELKEDGESSPLDYLSLSMRGNEIWIRNSTYPDMASATIRRLFGPDPIRNALVKSLGFDAETALEVLESCHELQVQKWRDRMNKTTEFLQVLAEAETSLAELPEDDPRISQTREAWHSAWQASGRDVSVQPGEIADFLGITLSAVVAVAEFFKIDGDEMQPPEAIRAFTSGDNPLRTNPLIVDPDGTMLLIHNSLNATAVREGLEQHLKQTTIWESYQTHRGELLERMTDEALSAAIPDSTTYAAFNYFVPASEAEEIGPPAGYTKRVEGDLLHIVDDIAIIVEAKAIAVNPRSRSGDTRKLRRDLVGIISNASSQAARLAERIELDGGIKLHSNQWIDLTHVRELHLVAVSLEDLVSVSTATAALASAEIIDEKRIPWTVSIHDLQIICELVSTPAELILYLQRRTTLETTVAYVAPDELDLFLYFFESGLYVPPNPDSVSEELSYFVPRTSDRRRRREVARSLITSRTDPLDRWHYTRTAPAEMRHPKPRMAKAPIQDLVRLLADRREFGWLSMGAALLSGSTKAQADMERVPRNLLAQPHPSGRERSMTMPLGSTKSNAWLFVWATQPEGWTQKDLEAHISGYMNAKKYQLGIRRAAAFIYSENTKELVSVLYRGDSLEASAELDAQVSHLFPASYTPSPLPPRAKRRKHK